MDIMFRDSDEAFEDAIHNAGALNSDPRAPNFAGAFMYMGTVPATSDDSAALGIRATEVDLFKHIQTRQYLRVPYAV